VAAITAIKHGRRDDVTARSQISQGWPVRENTSVFDSINSDLF